MQSLFLFCADSPVFLVGVSKTFISIYESNSQDDTKSLLSTYNNTLTSLSIQHKFVSEDTEDRWWPYGTAPERIAYLAGMRNKALDVVNDVEVDYSWGDGSLKYSDNAGAGGSESTGGRRDSDVTGTRLGLGIDDLVEGEVGRERKRATTVIFLNDIIWRWQDVVRLLRTEIEGRKDWDMVCAMDFGKSGEFS
jgi:hypothetical protein